MMPKPWPTDTRGVLMPCRQAKKARQRQFQEAKINALPGLLEALDTETLPERNSRRLLLGPSPLRVN